MDYTSTRPGTRKREMEVMPFRVPCSDLIGSSDIERAELEREGRAYIPEGFPLRDGLITARGLGNSMEPRIKDGWWCIFETGRVGTRQGQIVLVEDRNGIGGVRYTLKVYHSEAVHSDDGSWVHIKIVLHPLNRRVHADITLEEDDERYHICGWYIGCVPEIERVENYRYKST